MNANFKGIKALVRVDFNVPLNDRFEVTDDNRIKAAVPTIKKILNDGGSAILMSHLGRPKDGPTEKYSLKHIISALKKYFPNTIIHFVSDCIGEEAKNLAANLKMGEILLLENLRFYKEEEKGDKEFAKKLAQLGDVYVNDAFGTAHRAHASTAIIAEFFPKEKRCFGLLMESEVKSAEKVSKNSEQPFTAILGGAKVSDKILIIENLLNIANNIIIGGGMAYTFIKAQGGKIGNSLLEEERIPTALEIFKKAREKKVNLYIPVDGLITEKFDNDSPTRVSLTRDIPDGWLALDIATQSMADIKNIVLNSKTILWNGPMGVFEMPTFRKGTLAVAEAVAQATKNGAFSLVGGGDSVAAVNQFGYAEKVSYVSTGGGAMLEYFEGKTLPGIAAVQS
ncbi:MAG: phosphoglycerate kinase [Chitinophagaceae bacterium]